MDELLPDEIPVMREGVIRFMRTEVDPVMDEIDGLMRVPSWSEQSTQRVVERIPGEGRAEGEARG